MNESSENSSGISSENFSESSDKQPMVIKGWKAVVVLVGIVALIGGIFLYPMLTSGKEATTPP